ncbi:helix-turn-helix domain-containing protein [Luteolibacter marinus]|uniref:helix-turn-helix domain-containing protein n=1 Tax=Luteolibacter marinus TaxID=2776705 RepID=UPI001865A861|nr:AraC family transcriptional regulator [Luteolibacter marinus]
MKLDACCQDGAGECDSTADSADFSARETDDWIVRDTADDDPASRAACDYPGVTKAIETIHNHYSRPLTVSSLARECGMSVRSLHRYYRAATGNTIGKALVARRVEAAAEMLREDDIKLEPVAMETGLRNAKNLCRLFKEHIGVTPGQWKEAFHGSAARVS